MRYFIILLFLSFSWHQVAQEEVFNKKFNLEWTVEKDFIFGYSDSWELPVIKGQSIDHDRMLPIYAAKWEAPPYSDIKSYKIINVQYETVKSANLLDIKEENIPNDIESSLVVLSTRNDFHAYLNMIPLIKDANSYKKIKSFEVQYTLKNQVKSKHSYRSNSVLSSGTWYKFSVDTTGVYKLDRDFLNDLGLSTGSINPKNISIYGNGGHLLPYRIGDFRYDDLQENAIYVSGEEDGSFDSNDYILFYALGPHSWKHENTLESVEHVRNIYSDKAYYFVHVKDQAGLRITSLPSGTVGNIALTNYDDFEVHEIDEYNIIHSGQKWLGEKFSTTNTREISMAFENMDVNYPLKVKTAAVAASTQSSTMNIQLNGQEIYTLSFGTTNGETRARESMASTDLTLSNETIDFELTYNNNGNPSAYAHLDYIEVIGKKKLIFSDKQFTFRNFTTIDNDGTINFSIDNGQSAFAVWDVTNPLQPRDIENGATDGSFKFSTTGGNLKEFVIINENDYYEPELLDVSLVENQDLHALTDIDYLIITKEFLLDQAEEIAEFHREKNDFNVITVPLYQIYNEYGSGAPDITAIRDFVRNLYLNSNDRLKYVLMYGDASYDFKNIKEDDDENIVPAFQSIKSFDTSQSFVTDDYFVIISDTDEGDLDNNSAQSQDIAVGRLVVRSLQEAINVNNKLFQYYDSSSFGDWRNVMSMIADDPKPNSIDYLLQYWEEALADEVKENKPVMNLKKIYADGYSQVISAGGAEYPDATEAILNAVEKGVLIMNYYGHGGEDGLAEEKLLTVAQVDAWRNLDNLPLIMIISCEFARLDNPSRPNTAGEVVIRNPYGAGVALIATARAIGFYTGDTLNRYSVEELLAFEGETKSIAESLRIAKNRSSSKQRYFVFSFSDPAMKLALPKPDIKLTHMNGISVEEDLDTIKALSHVYFDGIITDENGIKDTDFNGTLTVTVYDKPIDKQTLVNDGSGEPMIFDTQESKIFRGDASVTNGDFSFDFIAPKDIRIAYGAGKLSFYAHNNETDKGGFNSDIIIGGINENAPEDNTGPDITLFMNDKSFINGGSTNQSPLLLAFFEDESGINTSLSSVDHDITATLDGDTQNIEILNDYYTTEEDDFTKGYLEFKYRDLEVGPHTIKVKAYDTYNNPSEASIDFVVLDDGELVLEHVLNYPNPFINHTQFWFSHNKPNEPLEVQIQIFTVSGKLVKTIMHEVNTSGSLSNEITWNGLDDFGQKIGKGVYVYKLSVKAPLSGLKSEKFEKLVILQ